jgi:pimeloyl-ACP methyl ester carboxylesterase
MARSRKTRTKTAVAWAVGAAALGIGAGIAAKRLVGQARRRPDPHAAEDYGRVRGDRRYEVSSSDGAILVADEVGPEEATSGAIFLHGFCLDRTIWHHQYRGIDGNRRLIFYDARDHGQSRGGKAAPEIRTLASDLKAVLDRSGLKKAVLVGHSMGGMTVLEYCRENPNELGKRVKGIALANTTYTDALKTIFAAEFVGPVEQRLRRFLERILDDPRASRAMRMRGDDFSWLLTRIGGFGPGASPSQVDFTRRLIMSFPSPPLVQILSGLRQFDMEEALDAIDVPTLILAGGDDRITTVRASKHIAGHIPGSRLVVLDGAGHMSMLERFDEFNTLVGEFLAQTLAAPRRGIKARKETA